MSKWLLCLLWHFRCYSLNVFQFLLMMFFRQRDQNYFINIPSLKVSSEGKRKIFLDLFPGVSGEWRTRLNCFSRNPYSMAINGIFICWLHKLKPPHFPQLPPQLHAHIQLIWKTINFAFKHSENPSTLSSTTDLIQAPSLESSIGLWQLSSPSCPPHCLQSFLSRIQVYSYHSFPAQVLIIVKDYCYLF